MLAALAIAGTAVGCGGSEEASTTEKRASAVAVPNPLPPGPPGDLIRKQQVEAPPGARVWRILYHSRSPDGRDIAVSGLIVAPDDPPPLGGFPVVAWAHGTTGLADECAPSQLTTPDRIPVPDLWRHGYVVAATDYEGLGTPGPHPYLVGDSEARSVLDSVRAAQNVTAASAGAATVVVGRSQGGHAALFAGELARSYAPDIDVLGVVAAAPVAELALLSERWRTKPFLGYLVGLARAYSLAYPAAAS
jgi:Secretory lipase